MEITELIDLVSRWAHILAAILLVGGTCFIRFVIIPVKASASLDDSVHEAIRRRWSKIVMVSVLFLLVSGLYNAARKEMNHDVDMVYRSLVTAKIALGFFVFFMVSVLSGRSAMAQKYRESEAKWYNVVAVSYTHLTLPTKA